MKRIAIPFLALGLALLLTVQARAGALDLLSGDGNPDFLEDEDYEAIVDSDTSGTLTNGDIFVGMFTMSSIDGHNTALAGASFSGIIVAKVTNISGSTVTFGAVSSSEYTALVSGTNTGLGGTSLSNLPTRMSTNSAIIVFDDTSGDPFIDADGSGSDFAGINDALTTATDGVRVFEFGFTGTTQATAIIGGGVNGTGYSFQIALNTTYNGTGLSLVPVISSVSTVPGLPNADLLGSGATAPGSPGDFPFRTDTDLFVNPLPEPASLTLLALGCLGICGAGYRTRRSRDKKLAA